ncbi:hypothetical protein ACJIZ3_023624 [Penstemon smallii]|uniref:Large ribosomal subunit protein uL15/eL18 domain-containing protein n=1 Tax=Penstemon smallii TaxID=265156 RepID=A0ABD3TRJ2_9LAMI
MPLCFIGHNLVTALRFTETARARIEKAGRECLTFDQLAISGLTWAEHEDNSESEDDGDRDAVELNEENNAKYTRLAIVCDDGCVRIYNVSDEEKLTIERCRGRTLSVTWSPDAKRIYSGSSDGFIRCWDAKLGNEIYRITVVLGGVGSRTDLCIWSLFALRYELYVGLVSRDSSGSVQFWDGNLPPIKYIMFNLPTCELN